MKYDLQNAAMRAGGRVQRQPTLWWADAVDAFGERAPVAAGRLAQTAQIHFGSWVMTRSWMPNPPNGRAGIQELFRLVTK
jgi:hypothetical protein